MKAKSKNGVIVLLGTLIAIGPFSIDAYLPAFSQIATDFKVETSEIGLTLTTYFVGIGLGQLAYGPLMDKYGRRLPLIIGLIVYITSCLLCATAHKTIDLSVYRFFMALGACAGMVASKAVVRDLFKKDEVADVLSTLMLIMGVAPIIAPTVGGWIVMIYHWNYVFYFLAGFAFLMLASVYLFLPDSFVPNSQQSLNPVQVMNEYGKLLTVKQFTIFSLARGFAIGMLLGYVAAAPFIFLEYFDVGQKTFGYIFGSNAAGLILGSQINRLFLRRFTTLQVTYGVSMVLAGVTSLLYIYSVFFEPTFWPVAVMLFVMLFFVGFQNPNSTALALMPFTRRAGSASAFVGALSMIFGSIASWFVAKQLTISLSPLFVLLMLSSILGLASVLWFMFTRTGREDYMLEGR